MMQLNFPYARAYARTSRARAPTSKMCGAARATLQTAAMLELRSSSWVYYWS